MSPSSTIVFFGSGPVAAATLQHLYEAGCVFEAIITKPRPPHHKGEVPVLEFASTRGLPTFTPLHKAALSALFTAHHFTSPIGLVVDYGIIISKEVINQFPKGILNSHFSLLPEWRGADPITFAILSGQSTTGVSIMLINERLDEGPLLSQTKITIPARATTPELTRQLITASNTALIRVVPEYLSGYITPFPQPENTPTYSRKLTKDDGIIDFTKPAPQLEREVRAYQGWPKSKTILFEKYPVIVTEARVALHKEDGALVIPAGTNTYLEITKLIAPSGRTMSGDAFLRGYKP